MLSLARLRGKFTLASQDTPIIAKMIGDTLCAAA
jgi:hypothetical protein